MAAILIYVDDIILNNLACNKRGVHIWDSIRNIMSTQQRITITLPTDDHKMIHLRTTTKAEARQKQIYEALNIKPDPIGKCKTMIDKKNL